jgi:hypothetical protein
MKLHTISFILALFCFQVKAQDLIVKTNGDTIHAKILEVGINAISYKKSNFLDGPTFVESKTNIAFVKYANNEVEQFSQSTNSTSPPSTSSQSIAPQPTAEKNKIELIDNTYYINGQKAKRKEVNKLLGSSSNPAITLGLKSAKLTSGAQKIIKITSIPTTLGGGFTFLWTGIDLYNLVQRGRTTQQAYINAALSLLGTISLPITNKILKKKSNKMYGKLIDAYNVTN